MEREEKTYSTFGYGLIGIAMIGAVTFALLAIVIVGAPSNQVTLSYAQPPVSTSTE